MMAIPWRRNIRTLLLWTSVLASLALSIEAKKRKPSSTALQTKETSTAGFVSLLAMRLLFGLASMVGLGEWASGIFNGALRPPGSDYDDYGDYYRDDYDGDGGDDDDDYY